MTALASIARSRSRKGRAAGKQPTHATGEAFGETTENGSVTLPGWIEECLKGYSRDALVAMLIRMGADTPSVRQRLLAEVDAVPPPLAAALDSAWETVHGLTAAPANHSTRKRNGAAPDLNELEDTVADLLNQGAADSLLALGTFIVQQGQAVLARYQDKSETAERLGRCLVPVVKAVPESSLALSEQLHWVIDRLLEDEAELLSNTGAETLWQSPAFNRTHWQAVSVTLTERLKTRKKASKIASGRGQRRTMAFIVESCRRTDKVAEALPLLEKEVYACQCYGLLVEVYLEVGHRKAALEACMDGYRRCRHTAPWVSRKVSEHWCGMMEEEENYISLSAAEAGWFFDAPDLEGYIRLKGRAKQAKVWSSIRKRVVHFLESGQRPDSQPSPALRDKQADWPLPESPFSGSTRHSRPATVQRVPNLPLLIDVSIEEGNDKEVVALYRKLKTRQEHTGIRNKVATAIVETYPELARDIWSELVIDLIEIPHANRLRESYQEAIGYLEKMRSVYGANGWRKEWDAWVQYLYRRYPYRKLLRQWLTTVKQPIAHSSAE